MGVPIWMSVPVVEATALVRETGGGALMPPENPQDMADTIGRLLWLSGQALLETGDVFCQLRQRYEPSAALHNFRWASRRRS